MKATCRLQDNSILRKYSAAALLLLLPFFVKAQQFEISEATGYGITSDGFFKSGFSNEVGLGYHFTKHFSLTAFYETEWWYTTVNAVGISPDINLKRFYFGMDLKEMYLGTYKNAGENIRYDPAFGYGIHVGSRRRLYKHLYLNTQLGISFLSVTATDRLSYGPGLYTSKPYADNSFYYVYLRIGLGYRF